MALLQLQTLRLGNDDVHVWCTALDRTPLRVQSLRQILTADEQGRADRFCFQKDREHFIVARGLLRTILGRYLDVEPSQLRFGYNPHGKPALSEKFSGDGLRFNLSHSHGLALYAITCGREVGVDIEGIRPNLVDEQIAEGYFSHQEVARLRALPIEMQQVAFFDCWTLKEAYLKARGVGLTFPLNQFEVSFVSGEPTALLNTNGSADEVCRWSLQELNVGPGYRAALAVEGHGHQIRCREWLEE